MNVNDLFPSKYLSAPDLQGQEFQVTIQDVYLGQLDSDDGNPQQKPVIRFANAKKQMVLNKTNSGTIATAYGDDTDGWVGRDIILFSMMVEFKGKQMPGLRVRVPQPSQSPQQPPAAATPAVAPPQGVPAAQTQRAAEAPVDDLPF